MNDTHIDIEELERFALKSPVLSAGRHHEIELHIDVCEDCAEHLRQIVSFYEEIEDVNERTLSPAAMRIAERATEMREARIIELFPKQPSMALQHERPSVIALAAQDKDVLKRYAPAGTLLSTDGSTILRLTRDNELHLYLLQVHADEPDRYAYVLVSFDCIDGEYLTNGAGEAVIPQIKKISFRDAHAFIRLPRDVFHLQGASGENAVSGKHGHTIHVAIGSPDTKRILSLETDAEKPEQPHKLALLSEKGSRLYKFDADTVEIERDELKSASIAVLY